MTMFECPDCDWVWENGDSHHDAYVQVVGDEIGFWCPDCAAWIFIRALSTGQVAVTKETP